MGSPVANISKLESLGIVKNQSYDAEMRMLGDKIFGSAKYRTPGASGGAFAADRDPSTSNTWKGLGMKKAYLHGGIDFGASLGTPMNTPVSGKVTFAGHAGGYGSHTVKIQDDKLGLEWIFGHNHSHSVKAGDMVTEGQTTVGTVGSEGRSTGPHLHLEVRKDGLKIDPVWALRAYQASKTDKEAVLKILANAPSHTGSRGSLGTGLNGRTITPGDTYIASNNTPTKQPSSSYPNPLPQVMPQPTGQTPSVASTATIDATKNNKAGDISIPPTVHWNYNTNRYNVAA